jgi:hypothetical protein
MTHRIFAIVLFVLVATHAEGAMYRVLEVVDGRTIVVDRAGARATVILAGVDLVDEDAARALLDWTLASAWVMLEKQPGGCFVYRTPDAMFLNRELVLRGYARSTLPGVEPPQTVPVTYLGQLRPSAGAPTMTEQRAAPKPKSGSGTRRRSPARPSRSPRRRD